jgi:DNA polymerase
MGHRVHKDYETFGTVDLEELGAYRYASDPDTRILMLALALDDEEPRVLFPPDVLEAFGLEQDPVALEWALVAHEPDTENYAHSATFEIAISRYRMWLDLGLEPPPLDQWRCTAAMARRAALPGSLAPLTAVLGGEQKDAAGKALIRLFCMPQRAGKYKGRRVMPWEEPEKWWAFVEYCRQDVRSERGVGHQLSAFELRGAALASWQATVRLNDRGVPVNVDALRRTQVIIDEAQRDIGALFRRITGFNHGQRERVLEWFEARGYRGGDMKAVSVTRALEKPDWGDDEALFAMELKQDLSFSAVNKVQTMLDCDCGDGLVRGTLRWYGAGPGRWAGELIQPQNYKRPTFPDTQAAYADMCSGVVATVDSMELLYGTPLDVIASCIRHYIQPPAGQTIYDADYSAVEARIVCWLAGQEDALEGFRLYDSTGSKEHDRYVRMASLIFGKDWKDVTKDERWLGKQTVLGCGFQMWVDKFLWQCVEKAEQYKIKGIKVTPELAHTAVVLFREEHDKVVNLWYDADRAARNAILHPGKTFRAGPYLRFAVVTTGGIPFLAMRIPAGRSIVYPWPMIEFNAAKGKDGITYYGKLPGNRNQWGRVSTYGGKLVENATQGTAGDFMAHGTVTALERDFDVFMIIHDQSLAINDGRPVEEFVAALTDLPAWAAGMPLVAEGKVVPYYLKL